MEEPREVLPKTVGVIEEGMRRGLHVGAQVYVSRAGTTIADFGLGESRPGVAMDSGSMMIWWSATKPAAAIAIAQLWEQGKLDIEDRVAAHIPEFATKGKDAVTLRHLLTHTGGFRFADGREAMLRPWDELLARICDAELEEGWLPGRKAGYHPSSSWFLLGEIVRRLDGRPFDRYVREELFEPLGMRDSWVGMPPECYREYGDRIGVMHNAADLKPEPLPFVDSEEACARCVPAGGGRGPMRELGRLYEMLLCRGRLGEARIISPQTVTALTARHRAGMYDETFHVPVDWGLGFAIDSFQYGRHSSARAFGHGGARSSVGFCDPEYGLVVAVVANGMAEDREHYPRFNAISTSVYEDLGIVPAGAPGRDKPQPDTGLA